MASAFEQLLDGDGNKCRLVTRFGDTFKEFGNTTVADAQRVRPERRKALITTSTTFWTCAREGPSVQRFLRGGHAREVPRSQTLLTALREYYRWMRPQTYLFPGAGARLACR